MTYPELVRGAEFVTYRDPETGIYYNQRGEPLDIAPDENGWYSREAVPYPLQPGLYEVCNVNEPLSKNSFRSYDDTARMWFYFNNRDGWVPNIWFTHWRLNTPQPEKENGGGA
jgi:hypothetical protein